MHASPADFRAVRRDGVLLHFAVLDAIAFVRAEFPVTGSQGTFAEELCEEPHWGFVVSGGLEIELGDERLPVVPGSAFHIPDGMTHRLLVSGRAQLAGFTRIAADAPQTDEQLRKAGFELVRREQRSSRLQPVSVVRPRPEPPPESGEIVAEARLMGDLLYNRVRLGRRAGYTSEPCDVPHWGLVTSGALAIEWEDDVEIMSAGDAYYCPAGPPGHRLQTAEPAIIVDFTPIEQFRAAERIAAWRRRPGEDALRQASPAPRVDVAVMS